MAGILILAGSEAMEAAMKLARQFFLESTPAQPSRTKFIARKESYHGTTLGSLSMSGHVARRALFEPMLLDNVSRVSACNAYRGVQEGEKIEYYVARLAQELDDEFVCVGPDTVCAFVAEPVVGAVSRFHLKTDHSLFLFNNLSFKRASRFPGLEQLSYNRHLL